MGRTLVLAVAAIISLALVGLATIAPPRREGFAFLSLTHAFDDEPSGPLVLDLGTSVSGSAAASAALALALLSKWTGRSGSSAVVPSSPAPAPTKGSAPRIALGDAVGVRMDVLRRAEKGAGTAERVDLVAPIADGAARRHLLMYALVAKDAPARPPRTLAALIESRSRIAFLVPPGLDARTAADLVRVAWTTAMAPRGVERTFAASRNQAGLAIDADARTLQALSERAGAGTMAVLVLWTNASDARSKTPDQIARASGFACPPTHEPRFLVYHDPQVVDTALAMHEAAPYLRPDRVLLRDGDDAVRSVTVAYAPTLLIALGRDAMPDAHRRMVAAISREAFESSSDPARLAAECVHLAKTTGAQLHPSLLSLVREYSVPDQTSTLEFRPQVLGNHSLLLHGREGFRTEGGADANADAEGGPVADLVPLRAVTVRSLTYPAELRDSARSVRRLVLSERVIDGVTLRPNDRLTLLHQADPRENGAYVTIAIDRDGDPVLTSPRVVRDALLVERRLEPEQGQEGGSGGRWRLTMRVPSRSPSAEHVRVGDEVVWVVGGERERERELLRARVTAKDPPRPGAPWTLIRSVAPVAHDRTSPASWLDPLARCSSDPTVPTMQLCVSSWDVADAERHGPSVARSVWDSPCRHDVDCPFFDDETRRYGCQGGGTCAVPVGVRRVGYRGFDRSPTLEKNVG